MNTIGCDRAVQGGIFVAQNPSIKMIQRIQTLLLAVAVIALGMQVITPFALEQLPDGGTFEHSILAGISLGLPAYQMWAFVALGLCVLAAVGCAFTIFKYANRPLQLKAIRVIQLVLAGLVMCIYYMNNSFVAEAAEQSSRGIGYYMPVAILALTFGAGWFIRKDEKLVKSLDRLR